MGVSGNDFITSKVCLVSGKNVAFACTTWPCLPCACAIFQIPIAPKLLMGAEFFSWGKLFNDTFIIETI
jgi:hypothetical protein